MKKILALILFTILATEAFAEVDNAMTKLGAAQPRPYVVQTEPSYVILDPMNVVTGWAGFNNDTTGVETDLDSPLGGGSVEFDKVNGAANTVFGAVTKTLTSVDLSRFDLHSEIEFSIRLTSLTDVNYVFVRLGTSSAHYNEWRVPVGSLTTGWQVVRMPIGASSTGNTGNGWTQTAVTYAVIGVAFNLETNTLADIRVNHLSIRQAPSVTGSLAGIPNADTVTVTQALTVDTNAYAAGDCITTGITFPNAVRSPKFSGRIREVVVSDAAAQGANLELNCVKSAPGTAPCVDNAAFDPADADIPLFARPISLATHMAANDNGFDYTGDINVPIGPLASTSLTCYLVARGAPDYVAATDVSVSLTIERD